MVKFVKLHRPRGFLQCVQEGHRLSSLSVLCLSQSVDHSPPDSFHSHFTSHSPSPSSISTSHSQIALRLAPPQGRRLPLTAGQCANQLIHQEVFVSREPMRQRPQGSHCMGTRVSEPVNWGIKRKRCKQTGILRWLNKYRRPSMANKYRRTSMENQSQRTRMANQNKRTSMTNNQTTSVTNQSKRTSMTNEIQKTSMTKQNQTTGMTNQKQRTSVTNQTWRTSVTNQKHRTSVTNQTWRTSMTNQYCRTSMKNKYGRLTMAKQNKLLKTVRRHRVHMVAKPSWRVSMQKEHNMMTKQFLITTTGKRLDLKTAVDELKRRRMNKLTTKRMTTCMI